MNLVGLSEYGLINIGLTQNTYTISAHKSVNLVYAKFLIMMENPTDEEQTIKTSIYLLTSVAKELRKVAIFASYEEYAKDCVRILKGINSNARITLHRINYIINSEINYQLEDLCSEKGV